MVDRADTLLTIPEVAEQLKVGERFVRRLIFERRIAFHKIGRHVRISQADLDAFKRASRVDEGGSRMSLYERASRGVAG